jgi:hypothetical protein
MTRRRLIRFAVGAATGLAVFLYFLTTDGFTELSVWQRVGLGIGGTLGGGLLMVIRPEASRAAFDKGSDLRRNGGGSST